MTEQKIFEQLENYSNAIVALLVFQSIGFAISFGSSAELRCTVITVNQVATVVLIHFIAVTAAAIIGLRIIARDQSQLAPSFAQLITRYYIFRAIAIVAFVVIPVGILVAYGVRDFPGKAESCQRK